jgi:ribosomal protein S18 acetylase RimI-like enzyme
MRQGTKLIEVILLGGRRVGFITKQGGVIVATVSLGWEDVRNWGIKPSDAGYMHQLAVKGGHRGKNLGGQIINWLADKVAQEGRQFLRLDCDTNNAELCAYYEDQGFTKVGTQSRPDNELGEYKMALYERSVAN